MRRLVTAGRLALLDRGSSRRTTVMRIGSSEQPAHISLIRRRRRLILRCALSTSGNSLEPFSNCGDPIRQRICLTVGPSISAGTGAIIATCLALGHPVERIRNFYLQNCQVMFDRAEWIRRFRQRYEDERLAQQLKSMIGADTHLG